MQKKKGIFMNIWDNVNMINILLVRLESTTHSCRNTYTLFSFTKLHLYLILWNKCFYSFGYIAVENLNLCFLLSQGMVAWDLELQIRMLSAHFWGVVEASLSRNCICNRNYSWNWIWRKVKQFYFLLLASASLSFHCEPYCNC